MRRSVEGGDPSHARRTGQIIPIHLSAPIDPHPVARAPPGMFSAVALEFEHVMVEYGDWMLDEMIERREEPYGSDAGG